MSESHERSHAGFPRHRLIGLLAGPAAAAIVLASPAPDGLSQQGWWTAAVGIWMALWWMTEALPLAVTALLPVILFPLLGLRSLEATTPSYAHPLIFLFLGGFLLARALHVWGLHVWGLDKRLALRTLAVVGSSPRRMIAGLMAVTAFLSMWVSNTATTMVMLPIGLSVVASLPDHQDQEEKTAAGLAPALLLGIAYAATIGGMGTIIGTPPNALFAAFMAEAYGIEIGFFRWMWIGVPTVLVLLPIAWFVLTHVAFRIDRADSPQAAGAIGEKLAALGPMTRAEREVAWVMLAVAAGWVFRPLIETLLPGLALSDAGIAMIGALLLFLTPVELKSGRFLLSWKEAAKIRWDVLILFGGGLALAAAIGDSDLADWIGARLIGLQALPVFLLLLAVGALMVFLGELASNTAMAAALMVFLGELASNTAMAAVFLPVAGATALAMGEPAVMLTLPVALFATLGFILPVATPPNAIIFGSGAVKMGHMLRAGPILDLVGILVVALAVLSLGRWILAPA
jgi:sodium-dependent dicarboxylate transporter 2/3/5